MNPVWRVVGAVALAVAVFGVSMFGMGCQPPNDDSGTDSVVSNRCAELDQPPAGCEP